MDSLLVIREPVSRFISNFNYAREGSDVAGGHELRLRGKHTSGFRSFRNVGEFIDALSEPNRGIDGSDNSHLTRLAWESAQRREGGLAFRRQIFWVSNATRARLHFMCYHPDGIGEGLERALRAAGSNCSASKLPFINRTSKQTKDNATGSHIDSQALNSTSKKNALTEKQRAWVLRQYPEDAALYREHCEPDLPRLEPPEWPTYDTRWIPIHKKDPNLDYHWGWFNRRNGWRL